MLFKMKIQVKAVRDSMKRMIKAGKQLVHGESSDDLSQPDQSESSSIGIIRAYALIFMMLVSLDMIYVLR